MDFSTTLLDEVLLIVLGLAVDRALLLPNLIRRKRKKTTFVLLSGYWESGVSHFNKGMQKLNTRQRKEWYDAMDSWKDELYKLLEKHVPERLGTVRTVGLHATTQPYGLTDKQAVKKLSELWATLQETKKVIEAYSPL